MRTGEHDYVRFEFCHLLEAISHWSRIEESERDRTCLGILNHFEPSWATATEIAELAEALARSGEIWSWPEEMNPRSDVPSTGGAASLSTLVCPYILAACGCYVPKLSVAGTIAGAVDVLRLLPGFSGSLTYLEALKPLRDSRVVHLSPSATLVPADGRLFSLRSLSGKKSIPALVIASLLAKKLAVACRTGAVDVRCGRTGNFGVDWETCCRNAELFVAAAAHLGLNISCVVTDVDRAGMPFFGRSESLFALHSALTGRTEDAWLLDHIGVCRAIAAEALLRAGIAPNEDSATRRAAEALTSGRAYEAFRTNVEAQGAGPDAVEDTLAKFAASRRHIVTSRAAGYTLVVRTDLLSRVLGGINRGEAAGSDRAGVRILKRPGERVEVGEPVAEINQRVPVETEAMSQLVAACRDAAGVVEGPPQEARAAVSCVIR